MLDPALDGNNGWELLVILIWKEELINWWIQSWGRCWAEGDAYNLGERICGYILSSQSQILA
jgi:hypothetical protein